MTLDEQVKEVKELLRRSEELKNGMEQLSKNIHNSIYGDSLTLGYREIKETVIDKIKLLQEAVFDDVLSPMGINAILDDILNLVKSL